MEISFSIGLCQFEKKNADSMTKWFQQKKPKSAQKLEKNNKKRQ
jgi:hypothetical protein